MKNTIGAHTEVAMGDPPDVPFIQFRGEGFGIENQVVVPECVIFEKVHSGQPGADGNKRRYRAKTNLNASSNVD
jgi:hypothetical protein